MIHLSSMRHFGVICPIGNGHLFAMMALGRELQSRGHKVAFYQLLDVEEKVVAQQFTYRPVGVERFPKGRAGAELARVGQIRGQLAVRETIQLLTENMRVFLEDVPALAKRDGVDALIVDELSREGSTIAEELGIPFVTVSNALLMLRERNVPPFFTPWVPGRGGWIRNQFAYRALDWVRRPYLRVLNERRTKLGLSPVTDFNQLSSKLLHLAQTPEDFEFPRRSKPSYLHFVGPLSDTQVRGDCDFPYGRLDGRPLVYASLGTIRYSYTQVFQCIAEACAGLPVQLVITLGGGGEVESLGQLPGDPIVVRNAPQLDLLGRASLCITHAGLNTALESLANGVPMVAIPIADDQPGVAARVAWKRAGEFIELKKLNVRALRDLIQKVSGNKAYTDNAVQLKHSIARAGGKRTAALLIESVLV